MNKFSKKKTIIIVIAIGILAGGVGILALNGYFGGGATIPEDTMTRGLVGYWSFDEGGGNIAYDASGAGNNGTITTAGFTSPTIYVDGKQSSTTVDTNWHHICITTDTALNASDLDIGRREGSTYYDGYLDDVRIYSYARSAEQIMMDYQQGVATHIK